MLHDMSSITNAIGLVGSSQNGNWRMVFACMTWLKKYFRSTKLFNELNFRSIALPSRVFIEIYSKLLHSYGSGHKGPTVLYTWFCYQMIAKLGNNLYPIFILILKMGSLSIFNTKSNKGWYWKQTTTSCILSLIVCYRCMDKGLHVHTCCET